ncbi:MAG: DUF3644 domain-containing protein, partial [Candidatus Sericytochromatia bacterium]
TYLSKKLNNFVNKVDDTNYSVSDNIHSFDINYFRNIMSQVKNIKDDPFKPKLDDNVERLIIKARESAMLAVDIYNRPTTLFRTEGFIVMMIIAWRFLCHAIFEKNNINYYYLDENNEPEIRDGDKSTWDLSKSIKKLENIKEPVRQNVEFIILLRNKIEHRFAPDIDLEVIGHCQALLINFEELICKEFGDYYALKDLLSFPIQTISKRNTKQSEVIKKLQSEHYQELRNYIRVFEKDIENDVYQDPNYNFRVYLIPKSANHRNSSDVAIDFIKYDPSNSEMVRNLENQIAIIKEKKVEVQISNKDKFKQRQVSKLVSEKSKKTFTTNNHTSAWKIYNVRPVNKTDKGCNTKYCIYDEVHNDFVYTQEWIDFLFNEILDEEKYSKIISFKPINKIIN